MKSSEATERLVNLIKCAAQARLQALAQRNDIEIHSTMGDAIVRGHWMAFILMSAPELKIIYKVRFKTQTATFFAAKAYGTSRADISKKRALDFFREYCNLTAGQIALTLGKNGIGAGISVPILARSFDELYSVAPSRSRSAEWQLHCENEVVDCSVQVDVSRDFSLDLIDDETGKGDVEFL